jgi:hypothetical protein
MKQKPASSIRYFLHDPTSPYKMMHLICGLTGPVMRWGGFTAGLFNSKTSITQDYSQAARIASSKTVFALMSTRYAGAVGMRTFNPICVSAEHSKYLTAPISL